MYDIYISLKIRFNLCMSQKIDFFTLKTGLVIEFQYRCIYMRFWSEHPTIMDREIGG